MIKIKDGDAYEKNYENQLIKILKLSSVIIFTLIISTKSMQHFFKTHLLEFERERLHIKDEYRYKVKQSISTDIFGTYRIIQFESEKDIQSLEDDFVNDNNFKRYGQLQDSTSDSVFQDVRDKYQLPFSMGCNCYTLYAINESMRDGGYFYHILVHENTLYIYYTSR